MTSKVYETKEQIKELLATNDKALARAILALYARQTADEQAVGTTKVHNGAGFNAHDAPFLTSIAKALPKWNNHMTPRQIAKARPMMMKYAGQLLAIAQERQVVSMRDVPIDMPPPVDRPAAPLYGRF